MDWRKIREDSEKNLSPYAVRSAESVGRKVAEEKCPIRTDFERDHNRILYSVDFRRLRHKTQVFFNAKNDHICTRMEHVLYVAAITATITRTLNLNQDLAYAIALGHDMGHAPFGHSGERVLDRCVKSIDSKNFFEHETHSLRVADRLARRIAGEGRIARKGLNLTFEVRDGIVCHCGEKYSEYCIVPDFSKTPDRLFEADIRQQNPATMEGCVVRLADKIAYVGRDIEDAVRVGMMSIDDISKDVLGELGFTNGQIINTLVSDLIGNSYEKPCIALSREKGEALEELIHENVRMIYQAERIAEYEKSMSNTMEGLFWGLHKALQKGAESLENADEKVLRRFGDYLKVQDYGEKEQPEQKVLDFVAGMTDSFALQCYEELYWM